MTFLPEINATHTSLWLANYYAYLTNDLLIVNHQSKRDLATSSYSLCKEIKVKIGQRLLLHTG